LVENAFINEKVCVAICHFSALHSYSAINCYSFFRLFPHFTLIPLLTAIRKTRVSHAAPSYSFYTCIMGPFSVISKYGDLDIIFQCYLGADMSTTGFAVTLIEHLSHAATSYSCYICIMGPFSVSSKIYDLVLICKPDTVMSLIIQSLTNLTPSLKKVIISKIGYAWQGIRVD